MSDTFGMPGPGGSLGQCALCGKPFLAEVLLGRSVKSFQVSGCRQILYGHNDCLKRFSGPDAQFADLPDESPLKSAYLKQQPTPNIT